MMQPRWIASGAFLCLVVLAAVPSAPRPSAATRGGQPTTSCSGTISALDHPEIVPSYYTWEAFFNTLSAPSSTILQAIDLEPSSINSIRLQAANAISRAAAVRSAPRAAFDVDRESVAAESILSARDALIRTGTPEAFNSLNRIALEQSRHRVYVLPVPGKTVLVAGAPKCVVNVKARDYPFLVHEFSYWEFYLRGYAIASQAFLVGVDDYSTDYLVAVQNGRLPLPTNDLKRFLNMARETTRAIDAARAASSGDPETAALVLQSRAELIRTFSSTSWTAIQKDAAVTRTGEVFTFPPS